VGTASKAVVGVPEHGALIPIGLFQDVGREDQHFALVVQRGKGVWVAVLRSEKPKRLIRLAILCDKAIQHCRMALYYKIAVVPVI